MAVAAESFVGRSTELRTLLSAADIAASGRTSLALVGGEAGVGKSRLVAELAGRLREQDWLVLEGGCVSLGDDGLPYGPIVEALRALVRDVDPDRIAAAAGPGLIELTRLVPELSGVAGAVPLQATQAEWLQIRIFEGVLRLLGRLGETTPVALVIEDLPSLFRQAGFVLSTSDSEGHQVSLAEGAASGAVPVGRPLDNTRALGRSIAVE